MSCFCGMPAPRAPPIRGRPWFSATSLGVAMTLLIFAPQGGRLNWRGLFTQRLLVSRGLLGAAGTAAFYVTDPGARSRPRHAPGEHLCHLRSAHGCRNDRRAAPVRAVGWGCHCHGRPRLAHRYRRHAWTSGDDGGRPRGSTGRRGHGGRHSPTDAPRIQRHDFSRSVCLWGRLLAAARLAAASGNSTW